MGKYILKVNNLCKKYGNTIVLQEVSLSVPTGSIYGLIGENGAGKTTLFRILAGLSRQTSGQVVLANANTEAEMIKERRNIGFMIEAPALYSNLSVLENLYISQLQYCGKKDTDCANQTLELVGLYGQKQKRAKHLSLGMKQRLGLAGALLGRPPILILDEPTNGLDPSGIHEIRNLIKSLPSLYDCTVLISSHMLSEIELMADDIGILNHGRLLFEGSLNELRQNALQSGFAADHMTSVANLEDMFLSMVDKDNASRKQRAKL